MDPEVPPPGIRSPAQSPDLSTVWQALAAMGSALQSLAASMAEKTPLQAGPPSLPPGPLNSANSLNSLNSPLDPRGLAAAVNEFLVYQARLARSDRYLRQLRVVFNSLLKGRRDCMVHELTPADVRRWAEAGRWNQGTARRYVADVRGFLEWCRRRQWCQGNAAHEVRIPKAVDTRTPPIHTPEEVASILESSRANLDVTRHLAVRYFAGLRTAEAMALREEDLRIGEGILIVPAAKAKTRRRRVVRICPALAAWLDLGGQLRGIRPDTVRQVMRLAGVKCPPNVSRHSWCSYHLALHESAAKTALEAGHAEAMLFAHYRALVTQEAATRYFGIRP